MIGRGCPGGKQDLLPSTYREPHQLTLKGADRKPKDARASSAACFVSFPQETAILANQKQLLAPGGIDNLTKPRKNKLMTELTKSEGVCGLGAR